MENIVANLSLDEIIDFHTCANKLMRHQITEAGEDWILVLNKEIGLQRIFKWAIFVGEAIGEDFRKNEFQKKARNLSTLLQKRFSDVGLDISLWSSVFFYLGMIYTYSKWNSFIKITHNISKNKLLVLSRIDDIFNESIIPDYETDFLFIDTTKEDPIEVVKYLIKTQLIQIQQVDIFTISKLRLPDEFREILIINIHIPKSNQNKFDFPDFNIDYILY